MRSWEGGADVHRETCLQAQLLARHMEETTIETRDNERGIEKRAASACWTVNTKFARPITMPSQCSWALAFVTSAVPVIRFRTFALV